MKSARSEDRNTSVSPIIKQSLSCLLICYNLNIYIQEGDGDGTF